MASIVPFDENEQPKFFLNWGIESSLTTLYNSRAERVSEYAQPLLDQNGKQTAILYATDYPVEQGLPIIREFYSRKLSPLEESAFNQAFAQEIRRVVKRQNLEKADRREAGQKKHRIAEHGRQASRALKRHQRKPR